MAFHNEAHNREALFWNDMLDKIGPQLNVNEIQRLADLLGIPERPLEQILSDSNSGSALFKELDKNADLWFGESEKLKDLMLCVKRNDLVVLIDEYVTETDAREAAAAAAASCEQSTTRLEGGDVAAELGLDASIAFRNGSANGVNVMTTATASIRTTAAITKAPITTANGFPSPSSSRVDEISVAIDFLCENFADQAEWKPICRKLGQQLGLETLGILS